MILKDYLPIATSNFEGVCLIFQTPRSLFIHIYAIQSQNEKIISLTNPNLPICVKLDDTIKWPPNVRSIPLESGDRLDMYFGK